MKHCAFDIETGPLPEEEIRPFMPVFEAPSNYKDEAKIAEYVKAKEQEWIGRAALSALTGRVLVVGVLDTDGQMTLIHVSGDEKALLKDTWDLWLDYTKADKWIGHNCFGFDLPFMVRRSRILGVNVPSQVRKGRWWHERFVDTMEEWQMGNREDRISLANLARALRAGEKSGNGADFYKLWTEDRKQAVAYLRNDLELTMRCAERMGIVETKFSESQPPEPGPEDDIIP